MQGEHCFDRPRNGVHPERLKANGIDPKTLPPLRGPGSGKKHSRNGASPLGHSPYSGVRPVPRTAPVGCRVYGPLASRN